MTFSRRGFLGAAAAGVIGSAASRIPAAPAEGEAALAGEIAKLRYLTPPEEFREFEREKPRISELPAEKLRLAGLDPETWRLEVVPEPGTDCRVDRPLSRELGTALDWKGLMELAERRAVRFLKVMACTNMDEPLGMGLWEGVPLKDVIWMARPVAGVRRITYQGFHNDEPKQLFKSSLSIGRVLEDPPGELPVILCYKLNGRWLSIKAGGPVRMVVPEAYGNRSVKWLQRIILTSSHQASDTYALWGNDVESPLKTLARFIHPPERARADRPLPLVGLAQVGASGLGKVQVSLRPQDAPLAADDPYLERLDWRDARILPPPEDWGGGLPGGKVPPAPLQFDMESEKPRTWPLRYTIVHWVAMVAAPAPGRYLIRCRAIDANGIAQPLPRPLSKSGNNAIQEAPLVVEA